mmetsp:Transcript_57042/g.163858  ORF Transcript_57042/g.163858 Transcript_57042/m.163858 type:complete len:215 (-) Transcript_57042:239-883(-)
MSNWSWLLIKLMCPVGGREISQQSAASWRASQGFTSRSCRFSRRARRFSWSRCRGMRSASSPELQVFRLSDTTSILRRLHCTTSRFSAPNSRRASLAPSKRHCPWQRRGARVSPCRWWSSNARSYMHAGSRTSVRSCGCCGASPVWPRARSTWRRCRCRASLPWRSPPTSSSARMARAWHGWLRCRRARRSWRPCLGTCRASSCALTAGTTRGI